MKHKPGHFKKLLLEQTIDTGSGVLTYYACSICPEGSVSDLDGTNVSGLPSCSPAVSFDIPVSDMQNNFSSNYDPNKLFVSYEYIGSDPEILAYDVLGQGINLDDSYGNISQGIPPSWFGGNYGVSPWPQILYLDESIPSCVTSSGQPPVEEDNCVELQNSNPQLYDYCYSHCNMPGANLPSQCPDNFIECCPGDDETGCPEGMIDDTSPFWNLCVKCYTGSTEGSNITGGPPDCECCRPMDEPPEEKLTCYKCKDKGTNAVVAVQFPNSLSAWANFNFQGECPKGWTTNPNPCKPPGTAGMGLPPRNRRRR